MQHPSGDNVPVNPIEPARQALCGSRLHRRETIALATTAEHEHRGPLPGLTHRYSLMSASPTAGENPSPCTEPGKNAFFVDGESNQAPL